MIATGTVRSKMLARVQRRVPECWSGPITHNLGLGSCVKPPGFDAISYPCQNCPMSLPIFVLLNRASSVSLCSEYALASAFLLRTAQPPLASVEGRTVRELRRIGKRIVIRLEGGLDDDLWLALHSLMIAGRVALAGARCEVGGTSESGGVRFP